MKDTQVILEIIKELRADASLNYKKEVLVRYSDYEPFKEFLIRVYNPRINYYLRKVPDIISYGMKEQSTHELYGTLDALSSRIITGGAAINYVRNFLLEANQTVRELFELAIGRDIRAGVGVGIINEVYKGLVEEIFYQRCSKLNEKALERFDTMPDGFLTQKKSDGIFSYIIVQEGEVSLLTRAGTPWTSDKLSKELKHLPNCVIIGEALVIISGKGKYEGKIGSLTLQTSCGRIEVDCGSGLTDLDRNKHPDEFIGKIIEIKYNKFIQSKKDKPASLYLPRFVEVREDKNTATSYEEIVG